MEFSFEDQALNKVLKKIRISGSGKYEQWWRILLPFIICWLPLAIITLIQGSFWTGNMDTSFITNFDTQARFLVTMPILIIAERLVSARLAQIIYQFKNSGIIRKEDYSAFDENIIRKLRFLNSRWTYFAIFILCYAQVIAVFMYESEFTSVLSWQVVDHGGDVSLNLAGKWSAIISRPFLLFLFYRWFLRIVIWGMILYKISRLNLNLFAVHPDLAGGIGFLGYSIRYFSPIAFAISATVVGNMADFMLIEGLQLVDLKLQMAGYLIFITLLFTLPLLSFTSKLINAREQSVYENNDFANGIYRELRSKLLKGYDNVNAEDLSSPDYSAASDLSGIVNNALSMKFLPFSLRDMIPLWAMTALPFLCIVLLEIPFSELFSKVFSIVV